MKVIHLETLRLPKNVFFKMYGPPYFIITRPDDMSAEEHAVKCSLMRYEAEYGKNHGRIYIHQANVLIELKE